MKTMHRHRKSVFLLLLTAVLICGIFAGCGVEKKTGNPAFHAILEKQDIYFDPSVSDGYELSAFAKEIEPGLITVEEYKHKGDVISRICRQEYYNFQGKTDEEVAGLKNNIEYFVDTVNHLPGFYANASMKGDNYCYKVLVSGMDDPEIFQKIKQQGVLIMEDYDADHLSFSFMRKLLLQEGYTES